MQNEVGGSIYLSGRITKCNSCLFKKIIKLYKNITI